MAYIKIKPIKTGTHLDMVLNYIQNPHKTDDKVYVSAYKCSAKYAASNFNEIYKMAMKKGNNIAHHICQSFSPEDKINPCQAMEIGMELMKRMYPQYQYVIATHTDREHIHNHIIVNAVNYETFRKLHSNKESLDEMRNISDDICREMGISVIKSEGKKREVKHIYDDKAVRMSHRKKLKINVDKALEKSRNFDEFLALMKSWNYEIKQGKHLAFKHITGKKYLRIDSFGDEYSEEMLRLRFTDYYEYIRRKKELKIDKLVKTENKFNNRYIEARNVNIEIRMLNFLNESGIDTYAELLNKYEKTVRLLEAQKKNLDSLNNRISNSRKVIKSIRSYWQYKPVFQRYNRLENLSEKETFESENRDNLNRYYAAVEVLNDSKKEDGSLPKAAEINSDIARAEILKEWIAEEYYRLKRELERYEILKANADEILKNESEKTVDEILQR